MSGELTPQRPEMRMSDADRERVIAALHSAVGEGRLTLDEFQDRVDGVLRSRTFGEIDQYLADLPVAPAVPAAVTRDFAEIRSTAATLRRRGRWSVPRRLAVRSRAGAVRLDFTDAVIGHPVVEIALDVFAGTTTLILPPKASVDAYGVEMVAGTMKVRGFPPEADPGCGPHFVVTGTQKAGNLTVRRQYRFWRWRW